jgi:signal transduction histidine kinase
MRRRAKALRGELEIDSAPGKGTRLSLRCPLPESEGIAHA